MLSGWPYLFGEIEIPFFLYPGEGIRKKGIYGEGGWASFSGSVCRRVDIISNVRSHQSSE